MNIHNLLSSKERVKILMHALYKEGCLTVNKTASELRLSKALIFIFFALLKKGCIEGKNARACLAAASLGKACNDS